MLHRFSSALPNGSGPTREKNSHCILDCIYHPENNTYYVMDLMSWKGYNLYDSNSEFRFFWVSSKLAETTAATVSKHNKFRFLPVVHFDATAAGFLQAYPHEPQFRQDHLTHQALQLQLLLKQSTSDTDMGSQQEQKQPTVPGSEVGGAASSGSKASDGRSSKASEPPQMAPTLVGKHGFVQDGLLFIHKETHYELGVTPLVLLWKDKQCSRFFLETEDGNTVSSQQVATLSCNKDRTVRCLEGQVLGTLPEAFVSLQAFEDGDLVKMGLQGVEPEADRVQAMNFLSKASKSRILADTWSKIVFQHQARSGTAITAEQLHQFLQSEPSSALDVSDVSSACQKF
jgi:snurportin-1